MIIKLETKETTFQFQQGFNMKVYLILTLIIIMFFPLTLFSNNKKGIKNLNYTPINRFAVKKDPLMSGLLSTVMPGVGQIYSQDYTRGSLIVVGDFVGKASLIAIIINLTNKYSQNDNTLSWEEMTGGDKSILLSVSVLYLGFYIWNIFDAVDSAEKYNQKHFYEPNFGISFNQDKKRFLLGINSKF